MGAQGVFFAVLSKIYTLTQGLTPAPPQAGRLFQLITLEHGLVAGLLLVAGGIAGSVVAVWGWAETGLGDYDPGRAMRIVVPSVVALALGAQTIFSSVFLSLLGMPTTHTIPSFLPEKSPTTDARS